MRRLHIRPRQVLVAVLAIVLAFLLAGGLATAVDRAAIGGIVARASKTRNRPGLQRDRQTQNLADAGQTHQALKRHGRFGRRQHLFLQAVLNAALIAEQLQQGGRRLLGV